MPLEFWGTHCPLHGPQNAAALSSHRLPQPKSLCDLTSLTRTHSHVFPLQRPFPFPPSPPSLPPPPPSPPQLPSAPTSIRRCLDSGAQPKAPRHLWDDCWCTVAHLGSLICLNGAVYSVTRGSSACLVRATARHLDCASWVRQKRVRESQAFQVDTLPQCPFLLAPPLVVTRRWPPPRT